MLRERRKTRNASCGDGVEVSLEDGDALEGVGGVDAVDVEFHPDHPTPVGEGHAVGELAHDEDALAAGGVAGGEVAELTVVEPGPLVGHLDEEAAAAGAEGEGDSLGGVGPVAVEDGVLGGLEGGHLEGGVVAADVAEAAEVEEALLDLGQIGDIRLYYKRFGHNLGGIKVLQIYKKVGNKGKKCQKWMQVAVYQHGILQAKK